MAVEVEGDCVADWSCSSLGPEAFTVSVEDKDELLRINVGAFSFELALLDKSESFRLCCDGEVSERARFEAA